MRFRLRWIPLLVASAWLVGAASSASALSLAVAGPPDGSYAAGTPLDFTVSLDQATSINGYEFFFSWDPAELSFSGGSQLYPDNLPADTFGFTVLNTGLGNAAVGMGRASTLQLSAFTTTDLLTLSFTATGAGDSAGSGLPGASLVIGYNGTTPLSPGSISVTDPDPFFTFTAVPEPGTVALLAAGSLLALALRGRRTA
jgi:hypothetical protein